MQLLNMLIVTFTLFLMITRCRAPPLQTEETEDIDDKYHSDVEGLTYKKYLKEVMGVLTGDPEFKKKLLADGKDIANEPELFSNQLEFVSNGIRTKLDELKRKELDRLRKLLKLKDFFKNKDTGFQLPEMDSAKLLAHLDHVNPNHFEKKDFDNLVKKATHDLAEIDQKRKDEFKKYEIMKELARRENLSRLSPQDRQAEIDKLEDMKKKHNDHPKIHHPGNEEQLKGVWEDDGMNKEEFDPRTFFFMHDTNGDNLWDDNEIEALFQKELDKVYNPEAAEDDMVQRFEEMYRMREHVVNEVDKNKDRVVSLEEFIDYAAQREFKNDQEWETIDTSKVYSEDELKKFEDDKLKVINSAKNKVRMPVDPNVVRMHQDSGGNNVPHHINVPQQQDIASHENVPQQQHIPQQGDDSHQQLTTLAPPQYVPLNQEHVQQNVPLQQDNVQQNVPQHQGNVQQVVQQQDNVQQNVPQHQDNVQQNVPQHQGNAQQNAPQHQGNMQQNVPQQDNIQQNVPQQDNAQQNVPQHQDQHNAPQQHDMPQQHDNIPLQQHIPEAAQQHAQQGQQVAQEVKAQLDAQQALIDAQKAQQAAIDAQNAQQAAINAQKAQQAAIDAQNAQQAAINAQQAQQAIIDAQNAQQALLNAQANLAQQNQQQAGLP